MQNLDELLTKAAVNAVIRMDDELKSTEKFIGMDRTSYYRMRNRIYASADVIYFLKQMRRLHKLPDDPIIIIWQAEQTRVLQSFGVSFMRNYFKKFKVTEKTRKFKIIRK